MCSTQARRHVPELESYFQQLGSQSSEGAEGDASECRLESIAESSRESPEDPVEASSQVWPMSGCCCDVYRNSRLRRRFCAAQQYFNFPCAKYVL